jgi:hypothetical protein
MPMSGGCSMILRRSFLEGLFSTLRRPFIVSLLSDLD